MPSLTLYKRRGDPCGRPQPDLAEQDRQSHNPKECHPERNEMEPRDLRILDLLCFELVCRSFGSLRSLRMTGGEVRCL